MNPGSSREPTVTSVGGQAMLWPSLAFGAAGNAYLWWRRARQLGDGASLRNAEAWLRKCDGAVASDYVAEGLDLRHTLCFGEAGVALVRALVTHARGDSLAYEEAFARFAARCSDAERATDEFLFGSAGLLHGARSLLRHTGDGRARQLGAGLARRLLARVRVGARCGLGELPRGFGHGATGVLHALVSWALCLGEPPSHALLALIEAHDDDRAPRRPAAVGRALQSGWCGGAAGETLFWVRAHELTQAPSARLRARQRAEIVAACRITVNADLCCGIAGRVYALLAMDRLEPGGGWLERAHQQLALVGHGDVERMTPLGLYKGLPGLACATADAAAAPPRRMGFPLIED